MKLAVINFSGNVGKTTVARHLLAPRIPGCQVVSVESINADDGAADDDPRPPVRAAAGVPADGRPTWWSMSARATSKTCSR